MDISISHKKFQLHRGWKGFLELCVKNLTQVSGTLKKISSNFLLNILLTTHPCGSFGKFEIQSSQLHINSLTGKILKLLYNIFTGLEVIISQDLV